jgi:hypothetical protein
VKEREAKEKLAQSAKQILAPEIKRNTDLISTFVTDLQPGRCRTTNSMSRRGKRSRKAAFCSGSKATKYLNCCVFIPWNIGQTS